MEAILDIYKRVYNPLNPVLCFDESSKQQIQDLVDALPVRAGSAAKFDSEYQRNGVSNLFMIFEPLQGKRHIKVTDKRVGRVHEVHRRRIVSKSSESNSGDGQS